uniref:F-box domain-containing protein n=1 Tax=Cannabis sativa TaxID=3483 RepID=A0A803PBD4_CANSA
MADSRTSFSNGSPITKIAQDHLFTILLLLPIDSIVAFAMSCKKFRVLATSDALWESICRRDWGPTSVDALKSSNHYQNQMPWMRLYKQFSQLDSVSCYKLSDTDAKIEFPDPRASHSLNFVSDCLVLFGGGYEGGRHLDDTWVAYIGNDCQRKLKWQKLNSGIPSGRFGHSCVVIGELLVVFGGIDDHGNRMNDTWIGQLSCHETLGITLSWKLLDVGSIVPPHRGAHAACCIGARKMAVHGGIGLNGFRLGDMWVLELSENSCFGTWQEGKSNEWEVPRKVGNCKIKGKVVLADLTKVHNGFNVLQEQGKGAKICALPCENPECSTLIFITFVYGLNTIEERKELWSGMSKLQMPIKPWLIVGDFITIYNYDDKLGGKAVNSLEIDDFTAWIAQSQVAMLKRVGSKFTWCNKQDGGDRVYSKIDHAFSN